MERREGGKGKRVRQWEEGEEMKWISGNKWREKGELFLQACIEKWKASNKQYTIGWEHTHRHTHTHTHTNIKSSSHPNEMWSDHYDYDIGALNRKLAWWLSNGKVLLSAAWSHGPSNKSKGYYTYTYICTCSIPSSMQRVPQGELLAYFFFHSLKTEGL